MFSTHSPRKAIAAVALSIGILAAGTVGVPNSAQALHPHTGNYCSHSTSWHYVSSDFRERYTGQFNKDGSHYHVLYREWKRWGIWWKYDPRKPTCPRH